MFWEKKTFAFSNTEAFLDFVVGYICLVKNNVEFFIVWIKKGYLLGAAILKAVKVAV